MKRVPLLTLTAAVGLVLPGALSAQSGDRAKGVSVSRAAAVWSQAGPIGSDRWSDERDSDSDSDWDSDSDSDSDRRRGGIFDRTGRDGGGSVDCRDLERDLDRAHDEWHRRNDRDRGDRRYEAEHDRAHDRIDDARSRARCDRGLGSTLEDIIFEPRDRDRRDRRDREDGGILSRIPIPGGGRDIPRAQGSVRIDRLGTSLAR